LKVGNLRLWAAIGNIFRVFALLSLISGVLAVFNVINLYRARAGDNLVIFLSILAAVILVIAFLFWEAKPALVSGSPFWARWVAGVYVVLWLISSLGLALVFIGIAYLLTGDPEPGETRWRREPDRPAAPRYKRPSNWQPTRRVGPSGTTVYYDPDRTMPVAMLDSNVPVQVTERGEGVAQVVAQTGLMGWVDVRTLT
jgi:hypothetical protein